MIHLCFTWLLNVNQYMNTFVYPEIGSRPVGPMLVFFFIILIIIFIIFYNRFFTFRYNPENIQPSLKSGRITAGLWGWMAASGPGELVEIDARMNSSQYISILEEVLVPSVRAMLIPEPEPIYLVMDNSSVHNAQIVKEWFREHPYVIRIEWPAKSPDLNAIENLWGYMNNKWDVSNAKTRECFIRHAKSV